jgi:hypothetical protein
MTALPRRWRQVRQVRPSGLRAAAPAARRRLRERRSPPQRSASECAGSRSGQPPPLRCSVRNRAPQRGQDLARPAAATRPTPPRFNRFRDLPETAKAARRRPLSHSFGWENWSGRRDSNPRPQPWQGCALPLSYTRSLWRRCGAVGPGGPGRRSLNTIPLEVASAEFGVLFSGYARLGPHQRAAGGRPSRISARRSRVARVVSSGRASRGKKPHSAISRSGALRRSTEKAGAT